jgi:Ca2+:H+ antiporter
MSLLLEPYNNYSDVSIRASSCRNSQYSEERLLIYELDKVKSAARREAWRDPINPFGRSRTHDDKPRDLETGLRITQSGPPRRSTEPAPTLDSDSDRQQVRSDPRDEEKNLPGYMSGGADSRAPQTSEETAVDESTSSAHVLPSSDSKTHHGGLISRLRRNKNNSENHTDTDLTTTTSSTSKKHRHKFTVQNQIRATLFNSWINVLLVAAPVGIALGAMKMNDIAVFVINFIAIIPLAALLSYATEEIAIRVGETLGGLLNASFG